MGLAKLEVEVWLEKLPPWDSLADWVLRMDWRGDWRWDEAGALEESARRAAGFVPWYRASAKRQACADIGLVRMTWSMAFDASRRASISRKCSRSTTVLLNCSMRG